MPKSGRVEQQLSDKIAYRSFYDDDEKERVHIYEFSDTPRHSSIERIVFYEGDNGSRGISLQAGTGRVVSTEHLIPKITGLLKAKGLEATSSHYGNSSSVSFKITGEREDRDLVKVLLALSTEAKIDDYSEHHSVVKPEIADTIIGHTLKVCGRTRSSGRASRSYTASNNQGRRCAQGIQTLTERLYRSSYFLSS